MASDFLDFELEMRHGDDRTLQITVTTEAAPNGAPLGSWDKFWVTGRLRVGDATPVFALTDAVSGGVTRYDVPNGVLRAKILRTHTSSLPNRRTKILVDVQAREAATGDLQTVKSGTIHVLPQITTATS